MRYGEKQNGEFGQWPVYVRDGEKFLYFKESFHVPDVKAAKARTLAQKWLKITFGAVGILGIIFLGLYVLYSDVLYVRLFLVSAFFDLIFWTVILEEKYKTIKTGDRVDISQFFSSSSLNIIREALLGRGSRQAHPLHLLLLILKSSQGQNVFYRLGIGYRQMGQTLLSMTQDIPSGSPELSEEFARLPFEAFRISRELGSGIIMPDILLAAISRLPAEDPTGQLFADYGLNPDDIYEVVRWQTTLRKVANSRQRLNKFAKLKPKGEINRSYTSLPTPVLDRFSTDLTRGARSGRTPIVVGREEEVYKLLKNFTSGKMATLLVGEHGVGKTTVIEVLAQKMVAEEVPESLFDKRLVRLELGQIMGEGERAGQALMAAINDAVKGGDIVLVIENIHQLAESRAQGSSLLNLLTSDLTQNNLAVVATTTPQDYQQYSVLQSSDLFERMDIEEPSQADTLLIAGVHAVIRESKSNTFWLYKALKEAVELSGRYIQTGRQPEKVMKVIETVTQRLASADKKSVRAISVEDVENTVAEMAHAANVVSSSDNTNTLNLEKILHKRIVGQDEAVRAVATAMKRIKARLAGKGDRPLASFLFVGPTGVGKTELAKTLSETEFGNQQAMIRLDLSEFNLPESVERLLGSRTHTSTFVAQIRERPYSVILLDELEKAHPEIQNLFLQVLDEGHLTDNAGNKIDLTNTIIIATSNAASEEIKKGFEQGADHKSLQERLVHDILPTIFRPELLNRFDGIILFKPLTISEVGQVVKLQLKSLAQNLDEQGIKLSVTDEGAVSIAKASYDPVYGARPVSRYIQEHIENVVADWLLQKQLLRRDMVVISPTGEPEIQKAKAL